MLDLLLINKSLLIIVVIIAAVIDTGTGKIPNRLTYPAIIIGLCLGTWNLGYAVPLSGALVTFVLCFLLFMTGVVGGGDVKLLTAIGAFVGFPIILDVLFVSLITGSIFGIAVLIWKKRLLQTLHEFFWLLLAFLMPSMNKEMPANDLRIPFGLAIALATLWVIFFPSYQVTDIFRR